MRQLFKDSEHLFRMAALFVASIVLFVLVRGIFVPDDFGVYGHFRAGAIDDNAVREPVFAGAAACIECHDTVEASRSGGAHHGVRCEACHGALARHAADPTAQTPERPEPVELCAVCHAKNGSKPRDFPQVEAEEHAMGESCTECHDPHSPGMS